MATVKDTTPVDDDDAAALKSWQALMDSGRIHVDRRALELSLHNYTSALHLCESHPSILAERKYLVLGGLGWLHRLKGRYSDAVRILEEALALADPVSAPGPPTQERVQIAGELGTVYRLMDRHEDARRASPRTTPWPRSSTYAPPRVAPWGTWAWLTTGGSWRCETL